MSKARLFRPVFTMASVTILVAAAQGQTTWYVDDDNCPGPGTGSEADPFCAIQTCIDAAVDGDECVVASGTYNELIDFLSKAITLRSSDGAEVTTIDGGNAGSVVTCAGGEGPGTVLDGFTITGGHAPNGGGMYNIASSPTVTDCTFSWNSANFGGAGGGIYNLNGSPTVTHCTFNNNSADRGGAIHNSGGSLRVAGCIFYFNVAASGGGIYNLGGSPVIANSIFESQVVVGSVRGGAAIYNESSDSLTINSVFFNGLAEWSGGAVYNENSSPTLINCSIVYNLAKKSGGGGLYNENSFPILLNCIVWGNEFFQILDQEGSVSNIRHCDVDGGWPGTGNIDTDPLFVGITNQRLLPDSPCIDAGNPGFQPRPGELDLDGHARILCGRVDMGAYESGIDDFDCDRDVDLVDFEQWPACFTGPDGGPYPDGCEAFDADGDADVDWSDFAMFQLVFADSSR